VAFFDADRREKTWDAFSHLSDCRGGKRSRQNHAARRFLGESIDEGWRIPIERLRKNEAQSPSSCKTEKVLL
jgi:hypothetical protein